MTQLFTRHGTAQSANDNINGRPAYGYTDSCHRCGGAGGSPAWAHTGWTCFRCGGSGKEGYKVVPLYTQEKLDQLNALANKRADKRAEAAFVKDWEEALEINSRWDWAKATHPQVWAWLRANEERGGFAQSLYQQVLRWGNLSEKQAGAVERIIADKARREEIASNSKHVGQIKDKIEVFLTPKLIIGSMFRIPGTNIVNPHYTTLFEDAEGNVFKYKGATAYEQAGLYRGTISDHEVYEGVKQTRIQRPKVLQEAVEAVEVKYVWPNGNPND